MAMKRNKILGIILIVLILIYLIIKLPKLQRSGSEYVFREIKFDSISKILIKSTDNQIELKKEGGIWYVKGSKYFKVNQNFIDDLLNGIENLKKEVVITTNEEKYVDYQLDKANSKNLLLIDSKENTFVNIIVGKVGPDYKSSYIRLEGKKEVFLGNCNFNALIKNRVNDWRDKTLWTIDENNISSFDLIKGGEKFSFVKEGDIWKLLYEGGTINAKESMVRDIINKVKSLSCADFEDKKNISDVGLDNPKKELILNLSDGFKKRLLVGNEKGKNQFYCMTSDSDEIYIIYNWNINFFDKKLDDFIQKEEPAPETQ